MSNDPNKKRIWVRMKEMSHVELIDMAAHNDNQTRQQWMKDVLLKAAVTQPSDLYLDKVVQRSSLIVQKTLELLFPKETEEAKQIVDDFLEKLNPDEA